MTTTHDSRPEWREWPELDITRTGIPPHIDAALQERYASPVEADLERRLARPATLADATAADAAGLAPRNHDATRRVHVSHLATEIAPGPPMLPRRRVDWQTVAALLAITAVIVALVALLNRPIITG